jgi:ribosome biogenesis GTPase
MVLADACAQHPRITAPPGRGPLLSRPAAACGRGSAVRRRAWWRGRQPIRFQELPPLHDHPLARLGWRAELQTDLDALGDPTLVAARVIAVDRGSVAVDTGERGWSAPLAGRLRRAGAAPATGDFVAALPDGPVRAVLPRRGVIARRVDRGRTQVLAANVDLALLATSLNRDLNPRRLARFLAITARGGVEAVVLLTKADLADDPAGIASEVKADLDGTPALPVSAYAGTGVEAVRALVAPGRTAVLLGTSGVGKSTLLNALLGEERQATQAIRAGDDRGRHTTVRRELVPLPGGALLVDTPGLRTVAPLGDADPEVPLLDSAQRKRERRARERAFHREIYREMRERRRDREARDRRQG